MTRDETSAPTEPVAISKSSPERIAAAITKGLLRREYLVGQRLIEADLTERYQVSRSTLREAFRILASRGVVDIVPYRGAEIRRLTLDSARELLDVLEVLIGLAARLAARNIDYGDNRIRFAAAAQPLIEATPSANPDRLLDARAPFYQVMLEIAGSEELRRAMPTWQVHLFRTQFYSAHTRADLRTMANEYRQIVDAVLSAQPTKAEMFARRHLQKSGERALPYLR